MIGVILNLWSKVNYNFFKKKNANTKTIVKGKVQFSENFKESLDVVVVKKV